MTALPTLENLGAMGAGSVGGKAASLGRLATAGFRVPGAFALPVNLTVTLAGPPAAWPENSRALVLEAYRGLVPDGHPVAVRSSGVDEDSAGASFAGQHATVLDVVGEDALLEATATCLASL